MNLLYWNCLGQGHIEEPLKGAMVVAYDVVGGFFAINGGAFSGKIGDVFYLAPDTLEAVDIARDITVLREDDLRKINAIAKMRLQFMKVCLISLL